MVRRKQAGLTHKQLAAKTGIRLNWIRRFEFDRCLPPQSEWDSLRKFLKLPPTPILTFTQSKKPLDRPKTIGERLRQRRLELKLCLSEAAPRMGVSVPTLGLWELGTVFPKHCYHAKITAFLDHDPFPKEGFDSFHSLPS
jgi:Predicted transcription factor, homolog of eukaryotic MBF1